jgi:hypothetical protein
MKIILKENQIKNLIESNLYYGEEKLPEFISSISKDILDAKKYCSKFFTTFKSLNINDIFDQPSKFINLVNQMKNVHKNYNDKSRNYYNILNTFENDFENEQLTKFDNLNSDFDNVVMDMDNIIDKTNDIVEMITDDEKVKETYQYFEKEYPEEVIDITGGLQIVPKRNTEF